nr:BspA family leucine-rich repeat surface protein [Mycoplasmopsis bovis]
MIIKGIIRVPILPKNIKQVPSELPSVVTSLEKTFNGLKSEKVMGIESWDTSIHYLIYLKLLVMLKTLIRTYQIEKPTNVTDMSVTFYNAKKFNSPLNNWDTYNVEKYAIDVSMAHAEFNQNYQIEKHSNVTNMSFMFEWSYAKFVQKY